MGFIFERPPGVFAYIHCAMNWIGLHLFNDDTRPSGHISRPSQVGFSHRCLRSINEFWWRCSVVGINSTWECRQLVTDLIKVVLDIWPFISDNRIQLLSEILLCKPPGSSQRGSSMSQLRSTHHDFVATLYIPEVCAQLSESGHNAGKQLVVLGTT